jgi:hypothetical protein
MPSSSNPTALVEVDVVHGHAVHRRLGVRERAEDQERAIPHGGREAARRDLLADRPPRPMPMRVRPGPGIARDFATHPNVELRGRNAHAKSTPDVERHHVVQPERTHRVPKRRRIQSEVEQRADRHVAAHAGERVEIRHLHRRMLVATPVMRCYGSTFQRPR